MTDIVDRLNSAKLREKEGPHYLCTLAADEIERLRAALREIRDDPCSDGLLLVSGKTAWEKAREALGDE